MASNYIQIKGLKAGSPKGRTGEKPMNRFEYDISRHTADSFSKVAYFCTEKGDCSVEQIPASEPQALVNILNERGTQGWELVQLLFGDGGVIACWKRRINDLVEG